MSYDPFLAALEDTSDDDVEKLPTVGNAVKCDQAGLARSLDAANAHDVIVLDDPKESCLSDTDVGTAEAAPTETISTALNADIGKRKRNENQAARSLANANAQLVRLETW